MDRMPETYDWSQLVYVINAPMYWDKALFDFIHIYISSYIWEHDTASILGGNGFGGGCQYIYVCVCIEFMAILDVSGVKETS